MDPYYLIQQEVLTGMEHLREILETREDMINDSRGINLEVFKTLGMQLSNEVTNVGNLVHDIEDSVEQIKANPSQFQISESELANREKFIADALSSLSDIDTKAKTQSTNQKITFHGSNTNYNEKENGNRSQFQRDQMIEQREEQLNMIEETVEMQLTYAREIDNELADQQEVLLALDENIDSAAEAIKDVTARIKQLIENEGKIPTMLVCILSIILVILLFFAA